jgi:hypothetical protein
MKRGGGQPVEEEDESEDGQGEGEGMDWQQCVKPSNEIPALI